MQQHIALVQRLGLSGAVQRIQCDSRTLAEFQITDAYTPNLPYLLGTRFNGGKGAEILFTGPDWKREVPAGMKLSRSPTSTVIVTDRFRVDDDIDLPAVACDVPSRWAWT